MASEQMTIASAVVLPEDPPSPPMMSKRRASSISQSEETKRRRLSIEDHNANQKSTQETAAPSTADRRRTNGQAEERKRGQRLFGALLGTLSQNSATTAQKRRADIEKKQQAKLKLQAEEYDEKKKKELERLTALRRKEQKKWDEQSMRIRHSNLLAMAHFLHTSTEPRLYYKPWNLLPAEEQRIKSQIEDAESIIEEELRDFEERKQRDKDETSKGVPDGNDGDVAMKGNEGDEPPDEEKEKEQNEDMPDINVGAERETNENGDTQDDTGGNTNQQETHIADRQKTHSPIQNTNTEHDFSTKRPTSAHETDEQGERERGEGENEAEDHGEVLVEADEDTVIY